MDKVIEQLQALSPETKTQIKAAYIMVGNAQDFIHAIVTEMKSQGEDVPLMLEDVNRDLYDVWEQLDTINEEMGS